MRIECSYSEMVDVSSIKTHPKNENVHPERQIKALAKIIAKNGQRSPIVISKLSGMVVKGHGRLAAIEELGWEKAAVDYQNYETELEEFNDRVADNEIARYAEFDMGLFENNLADFDLSIDDIELDEFGVLNFEAIGSADDSVSDSAEEEAKNEIVVKCKDRDELELLTFEFQSKGLSFEVKA